MNVYQVKDVIKKTECVELIYSSEYCSEPIMSKDNEGNLIDNYFLFSRNEDCSLISSPQSVFGIYTDKEQVAYMDNAISERFHKQMYEENFEDEKSMREARQKYLELFPEIRVMYHTEHDINNEKILSYVNALRIISGNTLFSFYKQLFPDFFEWTLKTQRINL